jgi:hypothetical protein
LAFPFRAEGAIIEPPKRGGVEMNLKLIGKLGGLLAALIILVLAGGNQEQKGLAQARPQDGQLPLLTALQPKLPSYCDEKEKEHSGGARFDCIILNLRGLLSPNGEENDFIPFIYWGLWRALHGYRDTDLDAVFYQALREVGDYRSIEQAVRTWEQLNLRIKDIFFTPPFAKLGHNGRWPTSSHELPIPFTIEGFVKIVSRSFLARSFGGRSIDFTVTELAVGTPVTDQFADLGVIFQGAHGRPAYIVNDGGVKALSGIPNGFNGPITITFIRGPVNRVEIIAGIFDRWGSTEARAYDASGKLLGSVRNTVSHGLDTLVLSMPGIVRVIVDGDDPGGWAIRQLSWQGGGGVIGAARQDGMLTGQAHGGDAKQVTMILRMLKCVEETFELSASDEIYLAIAVSTWRESDRAFENPPGLVIPAKDGYYSFDAGRAREIDQIIADVSLKPGDRLQVFIALMEKDSKVPAKIIGAAVSGAIIAAIGLISGGAPAPVLIALGALGGAISAVMDAFTDILQDDDLLGIGYLSTGGGLLIQGYLTNTIRATDLIDLKDVYEGEISYAAGYDYRLGYEVKVR